MDKEYGKELNNQKGSATVEAVVGFTAFLFAIFTILGMVNFCRAQMLVSAAVDTAAKEMSQYAYFYEMSGLQKFEEKLDENGNIGKNNINEIIGTVDNLYSSVNGAVDQTIEEKNNVANMIGSGELDADVIDNAVTNLENSVEGIRQGAVEVENAIGDVLNDPLLYMRSIVALIGSEGMESAKRAVAIPLAKAFVAKHFGDTTDEANAELQSLGIEGGLQSMDFSLSSIFSDKDHRDIEINVFYKIKLFQVFDWVVLEADVSKVAVCRAWLGGDSVIIKATKEDGAPLKTEEPAEDGEGKDEPQGDTETKEPAEDTEAPEEAPAVDIEGSYWYLDENYRGYNEIEGKFLDLTKSTYGVEQEIADPYFIGRNSYGNAYGSAYCITAEDAKGLCNEIYYDSIDHVASMEKWYRDTNGEKGYEPGTTKQYICLIYVPENISDEEVAKIETVAKEKWRDYYDMATEDYGIDLQVGFQIVKAGGNYDYGKEAEQ